MEHSIRKFMRIVEQASDSGDLDEEHDELNDDQDAIFEDPAGIPQKSEKSPVAKPGEPDLPRPLRALFSRKRKRR